MNIDMDNVKLYRETGNEVLTEGNFDGYIKNHHTGSSILLC